MKKPKMIIDSKTNASKEWIDELIQLKKEDKLQTYGEEVSFEKGTKSLHAGDIILYKFLDASVYCKAKLVIEMTSGKQIVTWTYEDIINN